MNDFTGHWHGYSWLGSANAYFMESARRPGSPAFTESEIPPMMTGHWLTRRIITQRKYTWTDPRQPLEWLARGYREHPPASRTDGGQAYIPLETKLETAADLIPRGVDVTWCYWTTRVGFMASLSVVSCPNRHHPEIPCPLPV